MMANFQKKDFSQQIPDAEWDELAHCINDKLGDLKISSVTSSNVASIDSSEEGRTMLTTYVNTMPKNINAPSHLRVMPTYCHLYPPPVPIQVVVATPLQAPRNDATGYQTDPSVFIAAMGNPLEWGCSAFGPPTAIEENTNLKNEKVPPAPVRGPWKYTMHTQSPLMQRPDEGPNRLHVSNIPFIFREYDLRAIFSEFGLVTDVEIIFNDRGSKGFGFVSFSSHAEALLALRRTNGALVCGRLIEVNFATERKYPPKKEIDAGKGMNARKIIDATKNQKETTKSSQNVEAIDFRELHANQTQTFRSPYPTVPTSSPIAPNGGLPYMVQLNCDFQNSCLDEQGPELIPTVDNSCRRCTCNCHTDYDSFRFMYG